MKLSNATLLNGIEVLDKLQQAELPIRVAFSILKNLERFKKEVGIYFEARERLVNKYALLDDSGMPIPDKEKKIQFKDDKCKIKWNNEINELLVTELEVEVQLIKRDDLLNSNATIKAVELPLIEFMMED